MFELEARFFYEVIKTVGVVKSIQSRHSRENGSPELFEPKQRALTPLPAAGSFNKLDSRFRGNDEKGKPGLFTKPAKLMEVLL